MAVATSRSATDVLLGQAQAVQLPETFSVQHVGNPLRRRSNGPQSPTSSASSRFGGSGHGLASEAYDFLFEVRSSLPNRPPWCIQRGYADMQDLHTRLRRVCAGSALPVLPPNRPRGTQRMWREDRFLKELASKLEEFLNTILRAPNFRSCEVIMDFLEATRPPEPTAEDVGEAAAEVVANASAAMCIACRAFCGGLFRFVAGQPNGSASDAVDVAESEYGGFYGNMTTRATSRTASGQVSPREELARQHLDLVMERQRERRRVNSGASSFCSTVSADSIVTALNMPQPITRPTAPQAREIHIPMNGKLQEWR